MKSLCLNCYQLTKIHLEIQPSEESLVCFNEVLRIDPNNDDAWYWKGKQLSGLGRDEEAEKCLVKARELRY